MKTESQLNTDILNITMDIKREFPELPKYLNEMPETIPNSAEPRITIKALRDYYDSLEAFVNGYALSHEQEG